MYFLLASASGVLLALSFPKFGHPAFGWIALAPLLLAVAGPPRARARAFFLGLTTGIVYFVGTLYWITRVMVVYGGFQPWVAVLLNAALIAYLALFPATFAAIVARLTTVFGWRGVMAAPFVWVATELGRTYVLTGFPWVLLGYSQATVLPIAQLASLFGVYGVSALVASVSAAAVLARRILPAVVAGVLVVGTATWGTLRIRSGTLTRSGEAVRIGLVQGNIARELGLSRVAAQVLARRGHHSPQLARDFLTGADSHDPTLLNDAAEACRLILAHIERRPVDGIVHDPESRLLARFSSRPFGLDWPRTNMGDTPAVSLPLGNRLKCGPGCGHRLFHLFLHEQAGDGHETKPGFAAFQRRFNQGRFVAA